MNALNVTLSDFKKKSNFRIPHKYIDFVSFIFRYIIALKLLKRENIKADLLLFS